MLPDLSVAPHWPAQRPRAPTATHQDMLRILSEIRRMICAYRREEVTDWRLAHAQQDCLINVVAGLIADARVIDELHAAVAKDNERLTHKIKKLQDNLADSKRPFSAQMEMQNRRIISITAQFDATLDALREVIDMLPANVEPEDRARLRAAQAICVRGRLE